MGSTTCRARHARCAAMCAISSLLSVATRVMSGDNTDYDHGRDTRVVATGAN